MHGTIRDLERGAEADTCEYFVAEPLRFRAVRVEGGDEGAAGGEDAGAEGHEGGVAACFCDKGAGDEGGGEDGDEVGEEAEAGGGGSGGEDGLEVEGEVVDVGVYGHVDEADVEAASEEGALGEDGEGDCGAFFFKFWFFWIGLGEEGGLAY